MAHVVSQQQWRRAPLDIAIGFISFADVPICMHVRFPAENSKLEDIPCSLTVHGISLRVEFCERNKSGGICTEGGMYDVTPREDEESSSGSYDEDDGNASYPTSSSFQFTCPAQAAVHEGPEQARASEGGALQPEPSTSTGRSRPSLTPLDRPSLSHSPRSSAPAHSSGTSAIPSSSLGLPPRTPGVSVVRR